MPPAYGAKKQHPKSIPNIKDKLLNGPRAKEFASWVPPQPTLEEVRENSAAPHVNDDQLLMYYVVGKDDVDALRDVGGPKQYISARTPLLMLLQQLTQRECTQIYIRTKDMTLALEKKRAPRGSLYA